MTPVRPSKLLEYENLDLKSSNECDFFCDHYQVGNAVTDDFHDYIGTFEYWWVNGLISDATYKMLGITCDFWSSQHPPEQCLQALQLATVEQGNIDPYSIYTKPCFDTTSVRRSLGGRYVSFYFNIFNLLDSMTPRYNSMHIILVVNQKNVVLMVKVILKLVSKPDQVIGMDHGLG